MKRIALFASLLALCLSSNAFAISAQKLGTHSATIASTNVLTTTTNDCPVGSLIVLTAGYTTVSRTLSSVADSVGNTWETPIDNIAGTGISIGRAYAINSTVDLPIGGTITATFSGTTVSAMAATCVSGAGLTSPLDVSNQTQQGIAATSATSVSSGTLAQSIEVLIGGLVASTGVGTVTCGGSWTRLDALTGGTGSVTTCTQVVASTASVAFAPSWVNSTNYVTDIISFKAPSNSSHNLLLLGVGK